MNHVLPLRPKKQHKPQHTIILEYLQEHPFVTNETVQELLSVKQTRAYAILREMINAGLIVKDGVGNAYVPVE
jgi:predicted HTH transcriptional regulator